MIYVASSLHNADRARRIMDIFRSHGITITYDWTTHGKVTDPEQLAYHGKLETDGVLQADVLFFIHPGRSGAHVELGIAIAQCYNNEDMRPFNRSQKTIIMLNDISSEIEQKTFYHLDVINHFNHEQAAIDFALMKLGVNQ